MNKVLIVIDAQEDFTRGALRNEEAIKALPAIRKVVRFAEKNDMSIIYTADTHEKDYLDTQEGKNLPIVHCVIGTPGWGICKEVKSKKSKVTIYKKTFGTLIWNSENLKRKISKADEIWLCGFCTDICVSANFQILKAQYPEIPIVVISDACAGVSPELHDAALKVMKSCQAKIITWEELRNET